MAKSIVVENVFWFLYFIFFEMVLFTFTVKKSCMYIIRGAKTPQILYRLLSFLVNNFQLPASSWGMCYRISLTIIFEGER